MAFVTLMIATYYSVVTGWTLKYALASILGDFGGVEGVETTTAAGVAADHAQATETFKEFSGRQGWAVFWDEDAGIPHALWFHFAAVAIGILIVWRGIKGGVELACRILIPLLFLMLFFGAGWVLTQLDGSRNGLEYLFTPNWSKLAKPDIWIDALSQSAWSTGAGWGLILAYGAYAKKDDDAVVTNRAAGLGNNMASLLAGMFIFPAVFALLSQAGMAEAEIRGALKDNGPGNSGLAFTYIPFIFKSMGDVGGWATIGFFVALFFAALSSLIALYEMSTRIFVDMGMTRGRAVTIVAVVGAIVGGFSAVDMDFFNTMDWVWGLALVIGGLLVCWAVQTYGTDTYRRVLINDAGARRPLGPWFNTLFVFLIPAQGIGLLGWWLYHAATDPAYYGADNNPWDPLVLGTVGVGPCVVWWMTAIGILWAASPWLGRWSMAGDPDLLRDDPPKLWIRPAGLLFAALPWVLWTWGDSVNHFFTKEMPDRSSEDAWPIMAAIIGGVLLIGFFWNIIQAGRGPKKPRRERSRRSHAPTEILSPDDEHA
jgi:NSS family neurotransmitter:Na+ symporter